MDSIFKPIGQHAVSACRHWLSGIVKCPICGANLSYNPSKNCPFFQCYNYSKGRHKESVCISEKKLTNGVLGSVRSVLDSQEITYRYIPPISKEGDAATLYENELARLDTRMDRIRQAYENGIDTIEEYRENKARLSDERTKLQTQLKKLQEKKLGNASSAQMLKKIHSVYEVLSDPDVPYETKGQALRSVVEKIIYDKANKKLLFYYYYK